MPIYEYRCHACHAVFEELVLGAAEPRCPRCAGAQLDKLMSAASVSTGKAEAPIGGCGACGDPRGPAACRFDG